MSQLRSENCPTVSHLTTRFNWSVVQMSRTISPWHGTIILAPLAPFPSARNDWHCLGPPRHSTFGDCHADNCDCLFFVCPSFLFKPRLIGQRPQFLPSHSLSPSERYGVCLPSRTRPRGSWEHVPAKISIQKAACQKVYGVARFPSLVSSSSFLKVKSANLGPSS